MPSANILGIHVGNLNTGEILDCIVQSIEAGSRLTIFPVNVNVVMKGFRDEEFRDILNRASITKSDGLPIVLASHLLGTPLGELTTGWILFETICRVAAKRNIRVFLLGGEPGIAERAGKSLDTRYPGLQVVGTYAPPFGFELNPSENEKIVHMINRADPHVVFVGLGAPKQEKWINRFSGETRVNVFMAVGGSFDFYAGKVAKPPSLVVQIGLGWLWRIVQEPSRLWRRYLIEDSPFLYHILRQRFGGIQRQP